MTPKKQRISNTFADEKIEPKSSSKLGLSEKINFRTILPSNYGPGFLDKLRAKCKDKLIETVRDQLKIETENEIWPDKFCSENQILQKQTHKLVKMAPSLAARLLKDCSNCDEFPI